MQAPVVDDDPSILKWMAATLQPLGVTARTAGSAEEALAILATTEIAFVVTDFMMPRINGAELLERIRKVQPVMPVVVMSGVGTVDDVVNVLRIGADDFLRKPIKRDLLIGRLTQIIAKARIYEEARLYRAFALAAGESRPGGIVTRSQAMLRLVSRLPAIARADAPVVVMGGPGSGKRHVARVLHSLSPARETRFFEIDCGSIRDSLTETELFVRAADALQAGDSVVLVEEARGKTVFFNDVDALPPRAQGELVRFMQRRESATDAQARTRVFASTECDLTRQVAAGLFREDLYYLLGVVVLEVPALEERVEDIPILATHFLSQHAAKSGARARAFSPQALDALVERRWVGNVRELENVVKRALIECDGSVIDVAHLRLSGLPAECVPGESADDGEALSPFALAKKEAVDAFERDYLARLLRRAPRTTDAAQLAGLERKGLWRLLTKHGLGRDADD